MVLNDAPQPVDPHVFVRGNPGRPGKAVPRQFLQVLAGPDRSPFQKGSGRLELARAIAEPDNPLTARVLVNRVWHWHFGQGLVATPSDFGLRSDPPSHPELLDDLAARVHRRRLVDQGAAPADHALEHLPAAQRRPARRASSATRENRLLWRFNRQRLDFEAMRDSLLAVAGPLDLTDGGPVGADQRAAVPAAAHRLRLHRPPEPRRRLPDLRLRRARRHQPAAVRHHRAPAGPLPHEQPVRPRAGQAAGRGRSTQETGQDSARSRGRDRSAGSIAASWADRPSPRELALGAVVPATGKPADRRRRSRPWRSSPRCCCSPTSSCSSIEIANLDPEASAMPHHAAPPRRRRADPPRAALPLGHGLRRAGAGQPAGRGGPARSDGPRRRPGRRRARLGGRLGQPAPAQGRRRFPARAKRVVHLFMNGGPSHVDTFDPKPMLDEVRRQAAAARNLPHRAQDRRGVALAVHVPASTARAASRSASSSPARRRDASTTSASSARCTPTCPTTSRRCMLMNCGEARPGPAEPGLVGHLRPGHREPEPARLRRHVPRRLPDRRVAELAGRRSCPASTRARTSTPSTPTSRS